MQSEVDKRLGIQRTEASTLPVATYCRVSSHEQKQKGDLERQEGRVLAYCVKQSYSVLQSFTEVGSGMNDNRSKLHALIKLVVNHEIGKLVVESKRRLPVFIQMLLEVCEISVEEIEKSEAKPRSRRVRKSQKPKS